MMLIKTLKIKETRFLYSSTVRIPAGLEVIRKIGLTELVGNMKGYCEVAISVNHEDPFLVLPMNDNITSDRMGIPDLMREVNIPVKQHDILKFTVVNPQEYWRTPVPMDLKVYIDG